MGSYASLSLGASGNVTYSGALTPSGSTYNLGGGGGTLTFAPAITGAVSLNVSGPGTVVLTETATPTPADQNQRRHADVRPGPRCDERHLSAIASTAPTGTAYHDGHL